MKFILVFLLVISPLTDLNEVARVNEHKRAAKEAYLNGDFEEAAKHYQYLIDSMQVTEESVLLNLANALFKLQDSTNARSNYNSLLSQEATKQSKSIAYQQLGLMDYGAKKYKEALKQFKNSLRSDPANEDARYNYELLKKLLKEQEEQQKQNQDQQNKEEENQEQQQDQQQDQQNQQNQENQENQENQQDQQDQEQKDQENQQNQEQQKDGEKKEQDQQEEGEENDEKPENMDPTTAEKLEEMNISEEKAKMILEALRNNEIQYIQQNKRKATKRKKDGKPDW